MPFDINQTLNEMLQAIKTNLGEGWNKVKDTANDFLQSRKERLELLADLRINNELENEFFLKRLADEKKILESELHALAVLSKSIAQKAANAAIDVLEKAFLK
jgi:hypothetical protein